MNTKKLISLCLTALCCPILAAVPASAEDLEGKWSYAG